VKQLFTAVKSNPRAMDILLDELAISDRAMPGTHRFIRGQILPEGKTPKSTSNSKQKNEKCEQEKPNFWKF